MQGWTRRMLNNPVAKLSEMKSRLDSWVNLITGLNSARDKTTNTIPILDSALPQQFLEALYHGDDIANRIVSALPDECFREPWTIINRTQDPEEEETLQEQASDLDSDMKRHGVREKLREAMTWGRLYGVGAVLIGADDGRDPWEPLDWRRVRSIDYLTVLDKRDLTPWRWYADPMSPKFSDVAIYLMQPVGVYVGMPYDVNPSAQLLLVHESRMIRFGGELTSKRMRLGNQGSDYSVLQRCYRALQLVNDNWQSAAALLADASQAVLTIKGLMDMITQQPDVMNTRFSLMDQTRSVMRMIMLDADGEKFERVPSRFEGIPDMLEQTWKRLASAARMPLTVLMGMSPAGMNATGESDIRWWYDQIAATQEQVLKPQLEYLLRMFARARGYDNEQDWSVVFPPLWQMTAKETADLHFAQAQADNLYLTNGVLTPEEVALSRFGGGEYALEQQIDVESRRKIMATSLEQMEAAAEVSLKQTKQTPGVVTTQATSPEQADPGTMDPRPPGVSDD